MFSQKRCDPPGRTPPAEEPPHSFSIPLWGLLLSSVELQSSSFCAAEGSVVLSGLFPFRSVRSQRRAHEEGESLWGNHDLQRA